MIDRFLFPLIAMMALASCAHSLPKPARFSATDVATICSVTQNLNMGGFGGTVDWVDDAQAPALMTRAGTLEWRDLPKSLRCPDGKRRLNRKGYGDFLNAFAMSADGMIAAVAGGFLYAPLLGGGGECYFQQTDAGWANIGCVHSWDS
jgi:hypothetical protein